MMDFTMADSAKGSNKIPELWSIKRVVIMNCLILAKRAPKGFRGRDFSIFNCFVDSRTDIYFKAILLFIFSLIFFYYGISYGMIVLSVFFFFSSSSFWGRSMFSTLLIAAISTRTNTSIFIGNLFLELFKSLNRSALDTFFRSFHKSYYTKYEEVLIG